MRAGRRGLPAPALMAFPPERPQHSLRPRDHDQGGGSWDRSASGGARWLIPAGSRRSSRTAPPTPRVTCWPGSTSSPTACAPRACSRVTAWPCWRPTGSRRWRSTWPRSRPAGTSPPSTGTSPPRRSPTSCATARRRRSSCTSGSARPGPRPPTRRGCRPAGGSATGTCPGSVRWKVSARASPPPCRTTGPPAPPCTTRRAPPGGRRGCAGRCPGSTRTWPPNCCPPCRSCSASRPARRTCTWSRRRTTTRR